MKTKRKTYTYPDHIIDKIENEARRRLREMNKVGTVLIGSVSRDIICISVMLGLSIQQIDKLSLDEFKQLCKRVKKEKER